MVQTLLIFLGGGLGAVCRFALSSLFSQETGIDRLPLGILVCNILGCFLIGLLISPPGENNSGWIPPFLLVGFLGGFTTFSSFGLETLRLWQAGAVAMTMSYILLSLIGSLGALFLAFKIMR